MIPTFYNPIPTTDLYFLNSCSDMVQHYPWQKDRPIKRIGDNTFKCGNKYLVIRRDKDSVLRKVLSDPNGEIIYLLDDDIWGGVDDYSLPEAYRRKMKGLLAAEVGMIIERASKIVVSANEILFNIPKDKEKYILNPYWNLRPSNEDHFRDFDAFPRLVHFGTDSHGSGKKFLQDVLPSVLGNHPKATFTYFSNYPTMGVLDKCSQVRRKKIMRWKRYRKSLTKNEYHIGLYPLFKTAFNNARSVNKVLELPIAGCVGLYSDQWKHASEHNLPTAINNPTAWIDAIERLIKDKEETINCYRHSLAVFNKINDCEAQSFFWTAILLGNRL